MNRVYTRAPHRHGASSEDFAPNAALLIDFDNVTMAIRSNLAQELESLLNSEIIRGKVAVQRAYADWRRYPQYIVPLSESSIDLIFAPAYGSSKKNATDIRLAIDALELVFTRPEIGTYILLSGDSDFSSLVLKLKEYGKYVIGVGLQESSSDILVQNCDEYYSYTSLSGLREASEGPTERHDPWDLVERALEKMTERDDVMRSDRLKQVMLELDSAFDEKSIGYSKFNRFLAEAASRDRVRLRKAANGQYEVVPLSGGRSRRREGGDRPQVSRGRKERTRRSEPAPTQRKDEGRPEARAEEPAAAEKPEGGRGVTASALRRAYDLLSRAVGSLSRDGEGVRDSEVKRKMLAEDGDFDEAALGFRKFSRFLQQAHDEGVVELRQGEDGNYYIGPVEAAEGATERAGRRPEPEKDEDEEQPGRARGERGRGGRRGRRGRTEAADGGREEATVVPGPVDVSATAEAAEPRRAPTARTPSPAVESDEGADGRGATRRGLGRFRRGSRGGSAPAAGGAVATGIGPVDAPDEEPSGERAGEAADESGPEADAAAGPAGRSAPADASGRQGGLGRFRRGSRGGTSAGPSPDASTPRSDRLPAGEREVIDHMVRNYPGVGERTASRLVDEFGDDVFEVIDSEPERITELLSGRRAQAVIDGRRAERASRETAGTD